MAGYNGFSMSNNAINAYAEGRMPLSKWTKTAILEAVEDYLISYGNEASFQKFVNLNKKELSQFLHTSGEWHHTSKFYNETLFYSINEKKIDCFCILNEPKKFIIYIPDGREYVASEKNQEGFFVTKNKLQAKRMTEYEANKRIKAGAEFNKNFQKIKSEGQP